MRIKMKHYKYNDRTLSYGIEVFKTFNGIGIAISFGMNYVEVRLRRGK